MTYFIAEPADPRDLPAVTAEEEAEFVQSAEVDESASDGAVVDEADLFDNEPQSDETPEVNDDPRDLGELDSLLEGVDIEDVDIDEDGEDE